MWLIEFCNYTISIISQLYERIKKYLKRERVPIGQTDDETYQRQFIDEILPTNHFTCWIRLKAEELLPQAYHYPSLDIYNGRNLPRSIFVVIARDPGQSIGHAMVMLFPKETIKKMFIQDGQLKEEDLNLDKEIPLGNKFAKIQCDIESDKFECMRYHVCWDKLERAYILEWESLPISKVLKKDNRDYYFVSNTNLNLDGLDILALLVLEKYQRRYGISKQDCLEYAKTFCRWVAERENKIRKDLVDTVLNPLTVARDPVKASSDWSLRTTPTGHAVATSDKSRMKLMERKKDN